MMDVREQLHRLRTVRSGALLAVTMVLAVMAAFLVGGSSRAAATMSGGSETVDVTINVSALPLDNLCNGDVVNLSGDMRIVTTTTPTRNGGFTVSSTATAYGLTGERIAPLPAIGYTGDDRADSYSYFAPPPYPSTTRVAHWTKLVPEGNAPTMWLVVITRETTLANGTTLPVAERAYLTCSQPTSHKCN